MLRKSRTLQLHLSLCCLLAIRLLVSRVDAQPTSESVSDDWHTSTHAPGVCAMRDVCGKRKDGDPLNCPANVPAVPATAELAAAMQTTCPALWAQQGGAQGSYCCTAAQVVNIGLSTQKVIPFVVGCPACLHNFVHLWCALTCSPDQSSWAEVVAVQQAADTNATVVSEINYWVAPSFGSALYDSCKDVKFGAANIPAMSFIGGGALDYQQWLDFLGTVKDKRFPPIGSPFQINFLPANSTPPGLTALADPSLVACGDNAFRCSCSDCPSGPGCQMPDDDEGGVPGGGDPACLVGRLRCWDLFVALGYSLLLLALLMACHGARIMRWLRQRGRGSGGEVEETLLEKAAGGEALTQGGAAPDWLYSWGLQPEPNGLQGGAQPAWLEGRMQEAFYRLGKFCAMRPLSVMAGGALLVGLAALGLLRFRLETDPQRLWVGPSSQAAQEKAAYEAAFGPFYRIQQLILTTTTDSDGAAGSARPGRPPILTPANIELLFAMQQLVDNLTASPLPPQISAAAAPTAAGGLGAPLQHTSQTAGAAAAAAAVPPPPPVSEGEGGWRLQDVCYKPFGSACAVQSVLQYWQMDRAVFRREQAKPASAPGRMTPGFCLTHWTVACRSAYGAPVDPHLVLGGFPTDKEHFRSFIEDSTALVVTYPLSSSLTTRAAALAWEAAFLQLAQGVLRPMARAANLTLSFSAERSVQDELQRESRSDAVTVALSYAAMLLYITLALGALPPSRSHLTRLLVTSRASLGLSGVLIVAGSVVGALGLVSAAGLWSTLIIMEVIPFLVLAVGVDNMFVLAHALQRQGQALPLAERVAAALSAAGPSITLAACCELLAFSLGALSTMPAVRNFSICAAVAIGLDFVLQVTVFVSCLALDAHRVEQHRVDCAPCIFIRPRAQPLHATRSYGGYEAGSEDAPPHLHELVMCASPPESTLQRWLHGYMHRLHIPALARRTVQAWLLAAFATSLALSLLALPRLSVGLDQAVALPSDSYLQPYFRDLAEVLRVGPPLFLVVEDLNLSRASPHINALCSTSGCDQDSMLNQVAAAARRPHTSFIAAPAASWVDDFIAWLNPGLIKCCRLHTAPSLAPGWLHPWGPDRPGGPRLRSNSTPGSRSDLESDLGSDLRSDLGGPEAHLAWGLPAPRPAAGVDQQGGYCPPPDQPPCSAPGGAACLDCRVCVDSAFPGGRPDVADYQRYLPWFLEALPSEACAKGGAGAYADLLSREAPPALPDLQQHPQGPPELTAASAAHSKPALEQQEGRGEGGDEGEGVGEEGVGGQAGAASLPVAGLSRGVVEASAFRTYYTPLNQQQEFIQALRAVRRLVSRLQEQLGLRVYAFSVFHVFFEQYLDVWHDAGLLLGSPLAAIGLVCWALTGSAWSAALMLLVLASLLLHLMGAMLLAGIQLNAVSLVNLAMALGIAVEFCAHVLHAFTTAPGSRPQRMAAALEKCGASVLSGITFTKLVGVAVLAAARTQIFRVYYFRLYLALVVLGALHGLVLLPILLALVGPPSQAQPAPLTALAPPSPVPYMHVGNVDILQPSGPGQPPGAQRTLR